MKENKKIFGRAAGVFALALALAFGLAACGGDDGDSNNNNNNNNGTTLGESALGETLIITGAQVYDDTGAGEYEKYTGGNVEFEVANDSSDSHLIGGKVKITGEKLDFTANAIAGEDLVNVSGLENYLRAIMKGYEHENFVISGPGSENAKYARLGSLSRTQDGRRDSLYRRGYTTREVKKDGKNYTIITAERADYVYVDTTITVTADGSTKTTSDSSGTRTDIIKPLNITLQKGWNVLYSYTNSSTDAVTFTAELKTGDPSNVHWINKWTNN